MSTRTQPPTVGTEVAKANNTLPEFVDFNGLRRLFGISRSTAYELIEEGEIRSICLRRKGRAKGRRLIDCESVREMFARYAAKEGTQP